MGWRFGSLGEVSRGLELARRAYAEGEAVTATIRPWTLANLARLHLLNGNFLEAEAALREAHLGFNPEDFSTYAPFVVGLADGELALAQGDYARVITAMEAFIATLCKFSIRTAPAEALHLKAKALLAQNRRDEADETLTKVRAEAEAVGSRRALWPSLAALAEIEAGRGHADEAQALRQQAREIVDYIANHCPPDLRASFLNLPDVRDALEAA